MLLQNTFVRIERLWLESKNEKLLSADIDRKIVDEFLSQASKRGFTKKRVLAAAVKLWTNVPLEIQAKLLRPISR